MTAPPFVIFGLPRSRTAWLTQWLRLASGGARIGHDLAIEADTIDGWLESVYRRVRGTCETGAVEAWPILRQAIPDCRIVTVHRDVTDVAGSLMLAGAPAPMDDLNRRAMALQELSEQPGVVSIAFAGLADPRLCADLQEHCLSVPFNWQAWRCMEACNVQIDMPTRLARLAERADAIAALKVELAGRLATSRPFVTVGEERWADVAEDCRTLWIKHHAEATEGIEGELSFNPAAVDGLAAQGLWRIFIARVDSRVVGYCCWSHEFNVESNAPNTMAHGPLYIAPEFASHNLGMRLLRVSRETLAADGYRVLMLHHTMHGRGCRTGLLYSRLGAVEYERRYRWEI